MVANKAQALPLVLLFHVALFKNVRTGSRPRPRTEIQLFTEEKYKILFSIRYFGVFIYKIRFPLLRVVGNTGSHCSSTQLCLCGVGSSPCWKRFNPPSPGRHCQAEAVLQAGLRPHLHSRCSYCSPSPAPALPQPASGCQGKLEKPCDPAGSWEAANGAGPRWGQGTAASAPAHQHCPHPQQQQHLPTHVVVGSRKAFTSAHRPRIC